MMTCRDSVLQRAEEQRNRRTARVGASQRNQSLAAMLIAQWRERNPQHCAASCPTSSAQQLRRELYMRRSHSKEKLRTIHFVRSYGPPEQMQSITKMGSMKTYEN
jgi:hypothetical protein